MVGLPDGEKNFEDMYNRLDSIPAYDRQTDRQTSCHGIVRVMHTRRAVKIGQYLRKVCSNEKGSSFFDSQCVFVKLVW